MQDTDFAHENMDISFCCFCPEWRCPLVLFRQTARTVESPQPSEGMIEGSAAATTSGGTLARASMGAG
jgi:hypothetical protein